MVYKQSKSIPFPLKLHHLLLISAGKVGVAYEDTLTYGRITGGVVASTQSALSTTHTLVPFRKQVGSKTISPGTVVISMQRSKILEFVWITQKLSLDLLNNLKYSYVEQLENHLNTF